MFKKRAFLKWTDVRGMFKKRAFLKWTDVRGIFKKRAFLNVLMIGQSQYTYREEGQFLAWQH